MLTDIPGREDDMILTFNYDPTDDADLALNTWETSSGIDIPPSGQALCSKSDPTDVRDFAPEPAGSWGGIIEYGGEWVFAGQEGPYLVRAPMG
jgi:hypothetical protein